ncbi:MAG: NAD(P)/FAD-dependent oxidoreductase [Acidobacteria bacterium]|nr:NAD(P)/FAD-dependent oxidoreductase [Acidobacteriota bacterium]
MPSYDYDAVVVGSGPNGLAAAITLAEAGRSVIVLEGDATPGGGTRTAELTLPGFRHDVCSAIHPMGAASPLFDRLPLASHGLDWVHPEVAVAHPLDDGTAVTLHRSLDETVVSVGHGWRRVFGPLVGGGRDLLDDVLRPQPHRPAHPLGFVRFGARAASPAVGLGRAMGDERAAALWAGIAAHAITSLSIPLSSAAGVVMTVAGHVGGWPMARGGSGAIGDALVAHLRSLGGTIECNRPVRSLDELPAARAVVFDTTPWQLVQIAGDRLPPGSYRHFRHGSASFKIDYALDGPMPWTAEPCRRAGTIHLGGTAREIAVAEHDVYRGRVPARPMVLVAQQSVADDSRAPAGKHTLWAYCHLPFGSTADMTEPIEAQLDRFAPGWRELVLARTVSPPSAIEGHNPNAIGGDIAGGASDRLQLVFRPRISLDPHRTPAEHLWLCSSSTPPGAGVHGMCGYWAAQSVLKHQP